jgi:hypothetical protein
MGDVVALSKQPFPVFLVPLLDVAASVESKSSALKNMSVGAPIGYPTNVGVVLVDGGN